MQRKINNCVPIILCAEFLLQKMQDKPIDTSEGLWQVGPPGSTLINVDRIALKSLYRVSRSSWQITLHLCSWIVRYLRFQPQYKSVCFRLFHRTPFMFLHRLTCFRLCNSLSVSLMFRLWYMLFFSMCLCCNHICCLLFFHPYHSATALLIFFGLLFCIVLIYYEYHAHPCFSCWK
jgi:hypothetical protein